MIVLAFLQNMWVRNPEKVRAQIAKDKTGKLRSRIMTYALFAGCLTGRRLKAALGDQWCEEIIWEEASPVITDKASGHPPPDESHIREAIEKHKPDMVICFSRQALPFIKKFHAGWKVCAPHPASRQPDIMERLKLLRETLDSAAKAMLGRSPAAPETFRSWCLAHGNFTCDPAKLQ